VAPDEGTLYVDDYATVQDALDAFTISSAGRLVFGSGSTYTITADLSISALVNQVIEGNGATINYSGAGSIFTYMTGTWSNSMIQNLNWTTSNPGATHIGLVWTSAANYTGVVNCTFTGLFQGISYAGTGNNFIRGVKATGCFNAALYMSGEYCTVSDCQISSNVGAADTIGVHLLGGNNIIIGNQITFNEIGIQMDSGANSDHGVIANNEINHNRQAGIFINTLTYGEIITGNQIAANGAPTATNLGAAPQNSSFGIYAKNATGLVITNNMFLRNKFNCAIEGINKSVITGNVFKPDNTLTTRHLYEVGGTNATYVVDTNVFDDDLLTNSVVLATDVPGATLGTNIVV
jgi:hypothetical protein